MPKLTPVEWACTSLDFDTLFPTEFLIHYAALAFRSESSQASIRRLSPPALFQSHGFEYRPRHRKAPFSEGDIFVKTPINSSRSVLAMLVTSILFCTAGLAADKYTVVRAFNPSAGGVLPAGALVMDATGNLYGTNTQGGKHNGGTIFELMPNAQGGWTYNDLYDCSSTSDCTLPVGSLVIDNAGNLYGSSLFGHVFELTRASGAWTAIVLHNFGIEIAPPSSLVLDASGNLYGINPTGGKNNLGYVFKLSPAQTAWALTDLHDFRGIDGAATTGNTENQVGGLIFDDAGALYGATVAGGTSTKCAGGCGVVFQMTNHSGAWTETVLHSLDGNDGANPIAPLMMDTARNLYGTASSGGAKGLGTVFQLSRVSGGWQASVLHSFSGVHLDGAYPDSGVVQDSSGNLYGTTESGGGDHTSCQVQSDYGCGMVFELSPNGSQWKESILKAFSGRNDGAFPQGVILDGNGNLYGAAQGGGSEFEGLIFELSPVQ
jgi:uncharacterized repeat protein (TIGR03803 family)